MSSDTLRLNPAKSLEFFGPFNKKSKSRLLVENPTKKRFCFKIKSNAVKNRILVSPKSGIVEPSQRMNVVFELLPFGGTLISKPPPPYGILFQYVSVPPALVDLNSIWNIVDSTKINRSYLTTIYNQSNIPRSLDTTAEDLIKENVPYNGQRQNLNIAMVADSPIMKSVEAFDKHADIFYESNDLQQSNHRKSSNVATIVFSSDNFNGQEFQLTPSGQKFIPKQAAAKSKLVKFQNPLTKHTLANKNSNFNKQGTDNVWQTVDEVQISDKTNAADRENENYIKYKALYNYETTEAEGLNFQIGDIILVNPNDDQPDPGWLFAELNGKTGWVPGNYLEKLDPNDHDQGNCEANTKETATEYQDSNDKADSAENDWGSGENDWGSGANDWDANNGKNNNPEQSGWGDAGNNWGSSAVNSEEPFNYEQEKSAENPDENIYKAQENGWGSNNTDANGDTNKNQAGVEINYEALYDYDSGDPDTLAFHIGDVIVVNPNDVADQGWLIGSLNGKVGWVPENFVAKSDSQNEAEYVAQNPQACLAKVSETPDNSTEASRQIPIYSPISSTEAASSVEKLMEAMNRRDSEFGNQIKDAITIALIIFVLGLILGKAGF